MDEFASFLGLIAVFIVCLLLYFLPAIVADKRKHHNKGAILVTNIFLGWTCLGWILALIWASTAVRRVG